MSFQTTPARAGRTDKDEIAKHAENVTKHASKQADKSRAFAAEVSKNSSVIESKKAPVCHGLGVVEDAEVIEDIIKIDENDYFRCMLADLPPFIQNHPYWLVCNHEGRPVSKPGVGASKTNPADWCDFQSVSKHVEQDPKFWPYIVLTDKTKFTVFDVDFKPQKDKESDEEFDKRIKRAGQAHKRLREQFPTRYEAHSKSGRGYHIIVSGKFKGSGGAGAIGGDWPEVEIYTQGHGIALTGHTVGRNFDPGTYDNETIQKVRDSIKAKTNTSQGGKIPSKTNAQPQTTKAKSIFDRDWTPEEIRGMLAKIPPRPNHDEWIKVISAVGSAVDESTAVRFLHEWSPEEKPGEYLEKLRSGLDQVGIGTLIHKAKENGWERPPAPPAADMNFKSFAKAEVSEPFPLHCLPSIAGEMACEIARVTTSSNEPLAAASILGIVSASLGAGLEIKTGGERRTRANLFLLAIAESGTGKGEAYKIAVEPFENAEAKAIESFNTIEKPGLIAELKIAETTAKNLCSKAAKEGASSNNRGIENYKRSEEECAALKKKLDAAPHWKVADVTKEAMAVIIAEQPGEAVASLSSEARGIFSIVKGRYGKEGGDEDFYCSAYSGDSLTVDRLSRDRVILRRPCLSILWMVQPDAAKKAFGDEAFTTSGLLPRFLLFDTKAEPKERDKDPEPIPAETKVKWGGRIKALAKTYRAAGNTPYTVEVNSDARVLLRDYENENVRRRQNTGDLSDLASFVARWTENAWRLALVLHAAKNGSKAHLRKLDATTAANAIEISRWFSGQQLEVVSIRRRDAHKDRLLALLATLANGIDKRVKFRDLRRDHRFEEQEIRKLRDLWPDKFKIIQLRNGNKKPSFAAELK
jgi:hypothetical protein